MSQMFLAWIIPIATPSIPGQPPGIWGGGNQPFPTPPIHIPPDRPIEVPPNPPGFWGPNSPFPSNPIANVPGVGPNPNPPGFGAHPEHPIYYPPRPWDPNFPTPPIHIPPEAPVTPPTGFPPVPTNPISGTPGPNPPDDTGGWMLVYFPDGNYYQWVKVEDVIGSMKASFGA